MAKIDLYRKWALRHRTPHPYSKVPNKRTCAIRNYFPQKSQIKIPHFFHATPKLFRLFFVENLCIKYRTFTIVSRGLKMIVNFSCGLHLNSAYDLVYYGLKVDWSLFAVAHIKCGLYWRAT